MILNSNVVGKIRSIQGSELTKETTQVIIRILYDQSEKSTHNYRLYCTNVNDRKYFLPKICGRLFIFLTYQTNFTQTFILQLKRNHNNPNNQNNKN